MAVLITAVVHGGNDDRILRIGVKVSMLLAQLLRHTEPVCSAIQNNLQTTAPQQITRSIADAVSPLIPQQGTLAVPIEVPTHVD